MKGFTREEIQRKGGKGPGEETEGTEVTGPGRQTLLHELLSLKLGGRIGYEEFCDRFEHAYNFEVGEGDLTTEEDRIFAELFDVVAWFMADESGRNEAPAHFKDKAGVDAAVQRTHEKLAGIASAEDAVRKPGETTSE